MKNPAYGFLLQNPKSLRYTINPDLYKNPEGKIYMKIFGKILANSILEKEIVGVDFAISMLKFLFDLPYVFNDLLDEFDDVTYKNYENIRNMSENDLAAIGQNFAIYNQAKEVELIENGTNIQVFF